jgi:hypothetical protein
MKYIRDKIDERVSRLFNGTKLKQCFAINAYHGEPKREVNVYEPTLMIFLGSNNNNLIRVRVK